ncbi:MAG: arginine--tRNA ligase [Candidatus Izemoplasmatales bacterium]|nr:arginine--tRNA ligase [Candidatus Izemoplasmatales bacterium]MDD5293560.1 arginine--tRNA ligase [Candidatus Izemoplasmatales bacterium]
MIHQLKKDIEAHLTAAIFEAYQLEVSVIVEEPKKPILGDLSVPVFSLVKAAKIRLDSAVAFVLSSLEQLQEPKRIAQVAVMGGFINLTLDRKVVGRDLIKSFLDDPDLVQILQPVHPETICIDYSSPNIAKPFSIGHLRSTIIGHAIGNLYEKCGHRVVRINHLGDFGTQFGKIIYSYIHFGDQARIEKNPIQELAELYVAFHEQAKDHPEMEEEARRIFKELEQGNPEYVRLWQWFRQESLKDYMHVYEKLHVAFDSYDGEAFYNDKMAEVIDLLHQQGLLKQDSGAMIVDVGADLPPALIQKSDGSTLYITRDLAAILYRKRTYGFDKVLYVVGNEQKLHFEQLKRLVEKMALGYHESIIHVNFGLVLQDGKKMSTRKGKVVRLIDVLDEAVQLSRNYIEEKNPDLPDKESIAEKVGVSAVIFNDLKNFRGNDFEFDLEEMVNFVGQTGPYLQYTSVRINSILSQADFVFDGALDDAWFERDYVYDIIKAIDLYPQTIERSANEYAPSILAKYLLNLASLFNSYYGKEKILVDDLRERNTKLHLLYMVKTVLNDGMHLLGMQVIDHM